MLKRFFVTLLILNCVFTVYTFANNINMENLPDNIYIEKNEDDLYVDSFKRSYENTAKLTEYDGVYEVSNGDLVIYNDGDTYQLVEKIEVSFEDKEEIESLLKDNTISKEVRDSINLKYNNALETGNLNISMVLFLPKVSKTRGITYYNYGKERIKEERIYYTGIQRANIQLTLSSASSFAERYGDAVIYTGGKIFKTINLASDIHSAATSFMNAFKNVKSVVNIQTSYKDNRFENVIDYDLVEVFKYVDMYQSGQFSLGLHTNLADVNFIRTEIYMYDADARRGEEIINFSNQNDKYSTPNYYSSTQVAIDSAYKNNIEKHEKIEYKIGNIVFELSM